jgi:hypothetical protein
MSADIPKVTLVCPRCHCLSSDVPVSVVVENEIGNFEIGVKVEYKHATCPICDERHQISRRVTPILSR